MERVESYPPHVIAMRKLAVDGPAPVLDPLDLYALERFFRMEVPA